MLSHPTPAQIANFIAAKKAQSKTSTTTSSTAPSSDSTVSSAPTPNTTHGDPGTSLNQVTESNLVSLSIDSPSLTSAQEDRQFNKNKLLPTPAVNPDKAGDNNPAITTFPMPIKTMTHMQKTITSFPVTKKPLITSALPQSPLKAPKSKVESQSQKFSQLKQSPWRDQARTRIYPTVTPQDSPAGDPAPRSSALRGRREDHQSPSESRYRWKRPSPASLNPQGGESRWSASPSPSPSGRPSRISTGGSTRLDTRWVFSSFGKSTYYADHVISILDSKSPADHPSDILHFWIEPVTPLLVDLPTNIPLPECPITLSP